jgi:SH3 domain-containing YSC84-like protein 1
MMDTPPTVAQLPPLGSHLSEDSSYSTPSNIDRAVANLSSPWEYDDLQPFCAQCVEEFSPFNRRHHCRYCGKIFCGRCSSQRCLIPPSSIVLSPKGGKKAKPISEHSIMATFSPDEDPDRMLTYVDGTDQDHILYGKGLEERFTLAREPLRVCSTCYIQLVPLQEPLRQTNSHAMRYNPIDPTDVRRLFNSPLAFTLGHEVRKAAYTINNLLPLPKRMGLWVTPSDRYINNGSHKPSAECQEQCSTISPSLGDLDGVQIPAKLLREAKGIATLTIFKGGFGLIGAEFGSGLVVARLSDGRWSAPSAIGAAGLSWGG